MRKLTLVVTVPAVVGLMALASPALAQTVTSFDPSFTNNGVWFESDVRTGGTASITDLTGLGGDLENSQPLPTGAALLTTDFTNGAKAEVAVVNGYGMPNNIFGSLDINYWYHKAANAGQNETAAPSIKLTFFNATCTAASDTPPKNTPDCFATLVYEPSWNGGGSNPTSTNPVPATWTEVMIDVNNGLFWTTGGFGFANSFGGPPLKTLLEWHTALSSEFGSADMVAVSVGVGSFNQGQIGYFDNVRIAGTNADAQYDFEPAQPATFIIIDEDSIDNGNPPTFFFDVDVNENIAALGLRAPLPGFAGANVGTTISLFTGEVGDEGWFALTSIPSDWAGRGPTTDGLRNYVGELQMAGGIVVGDGLGQGSDPEKFLDKVLGVTPLRATGLVLLVGQQVCAVVQDSDVSINYDPLDGSLKGDSLGRVAFEVLSVIPLTTESSSSLPEVVVEILDADEICEGDLVLFEGAPAPISSSELFDTGH